MPRRKNRKSRKPRLSLCMIVRNEERWLGQCLESVRSVVDEIVVVDTGSEDRTVQIALQYGAKVFTEPWQGDFSAPRNRSLREATGDWVLVLDADEAIPKKCLSELRKAIEQPRADAYRMTTRNYRYESTAYGVRRTTGEFEEEKPYPYWIPSTKIRLFRRLPGVEFRGAVHELVEESVRERGLKVTDLLVPVLHFGDAEKKRSATRYLEYAEKKCRERPYDPLAFQELAILQERAGMHEEAIRACDRALQLLSGRKGIDYASLDILLGVKGRALQSLGDYEKAIECYQAGFKRNPRSHEHANNLGVCFECLGEYEEAARWYERAVSLRPDLPLARENLERVRRKIRKERTLSVCMIVRNVAATLPQALESARHFADEIVVVDTGSTDETVSIAERYGAKIGYFEWCDDFAAARNASLELATGDWILWLDADDVVRPTEWPKLQELKFQSPDQAFMFLLQNEGIARESCWQVRMFPNRPEIRFRYPIHEQIYPALVEHGIPVRTANVTIVHTGYSSPEVVREKKERYLRILLRQLEKDPDDVVSRYHVAFTYHTTGRQREAVEEFEKIVANDVCQLYHPRTYVNAWTYLGRSYLKLGDLERAEAALKKAIELERENILAVVSLAELYNLRREYVAALDAMKSLEGVTVAPSTHPLDLEAVVYSGGYVKAEALEGLGRKEEAFRVLLEVQTNCSRFDLAIRKAARMLAELRDEWAEREFETLLANVDLEPEALFAVGLNLVEGERPVLAELAFRRAVEKDRSYARAWRALARIRRHLATPEAAVAVLREARNYTKGSALVDVDLADYLLQLDKLEEIAALETPELWPARLASRILTGDAQGILREIEGKPEFSSVGELTVQTIWEVARKMEQPFRFMLAVACGSADPEIAEALEEAARGWLSRRLPKKALPFAERYVLRYPDRETGYMLLKEAYGQLGSKEAVRVCEEELARVRGQTGPRAVLAN